MVPNMFEQAEGKCLSKYFLKTDMVADNSKEIDRNTVFPRNPGMQLDH